MVQMIWRRLKNLWKLSAYEVENDQLKAIHKYFDFGKLSLVKSFPTIKKQMATIIQEEKGDILDEEIKEEN